MEKLKIEGDQIKFNDFNRQLYKRMAEEHTTDKEYIDNFVTLFDFGFTDFDVNKKVYAH